MWPRSLVAGLLCLLIASCGGGGSDGLSSGSDRLSSGPSEPAFVSDIKPVVQKLLDEMLVPGAVVLIRTSDGEWVEAFGVRELDGAEPITPADRFRAGSNTKTMTGTVILQLIEEGKLSLDDPVSNHWANAANGDDITIEHLLNMRSGLQNYSESETFNAVLDEDPQRVWDPTTLIGEAASAEPHFSPGTRFHYSNTNTLLLGRIIEDVTGQSVAQEFERRIFRRVGMNATVMPALTDNTMPTPHARGYMYGTNVSTIDDLALPADEQQAAQEGTLRPSDWSDSNPSWGWTAGAVISNALDLAAYVEMLVGGGLLGEDLQRKRLDSLEPVDPDSPAPLKYGWALTAFGPLIGHDGSLPGYQSFMGHDPERGATVVILCNLTAGPDGRQPANELAKAIIRSLYEEPSPPHGPAGEAP